MAQWIPVARRSLTMLAFALLLSGCGKATNERPTVTLRSHGALTEHDFAADPTLHLSPGQVAATFLEPVDADAGTTGDTGGAGHDVIRINVPEASRRTYALDPADTTGTIARAELRRVPGGELVLALTPQAPSASATLEPGRYELHVHAGYAKGDAGGAPHRVVFHQAPAAAGGTASGAPRAAGLSASGRGRSGEWEVQHLLSTNQCGGCNLSYADLHGAHLRGSYLSGAYLYGANLSAADLSPFVGWVNSSFETWPTILRWADLDGASLENANLNFADIEGASFNNARADGASFYNVNTEFFGCIGCSSPATSYFGGASLVGADFSYSWLPYGYFENADITRTKFEQAQLANADFKSSKAVGADFSDAKLDHAGFRYASLEGASLARVHAQNADFEAAQLAGASFVGANLWAADFNNAFGMAQPPYAAADFSGATMTYGSMCGATFDGARFVGTVMDRHNCHNGVRLRGADLTDACLLYSTFNDADFTGASLIRTSFVSASLTNAVFTQARFQDVNMAGASACGAQLNDVYVMGRFRWVDGMPWDFHGTAFWHLKTLDFTGVDCHGTPPADKWRKCPPDPGN